MAIGYEKTGWHQLGSCIFRQVYTGNVHPVMEYGAAAWGQISQNQYQQAGHSTEQRHVYHQGAYKNQSHPCHGNCHYTPFPGPVPRTESPHSQQEDKTECPPGQPTSSGVQNKKVEENKLRPSCQLSCNIQCWHFACHPWRKEPLADANDWICQMQDVLFSTQVTGVTTKNSRHDTAHKASTLDILDQDYTTHQCGLMTVLMDPLMQQSETAGAEVGSTSASAIAKHFQGHWLQQLLNRTYCSAWSCQISQPRDTTPAPYCLSYRLQVCCPKPPATKRAAEKRHTMPSLWPVTTQQSRCPADPCSLWARMKQGGRSSCQFWQQIRAA